MAAELAGWLSSTETTVTNESIVTTLSGVKNSAENGLNDRMTTIAEFIVYDSTSMIFYVDTAENFFSSIKNGESMFFNASPEYVYQLGQDISSMSFNDWVYTASYGLPDVAASIVGGYMLSGIRIRGFKVSKLQVPKQQNFYTELMFRQGKERFAFRGANGRYLKGTGTPTTVSTYNRYLGLDDFGGATRNTPINFSEIGGSQLAKWLAAGGLSASIIYGRTKR